MDKDVAVDQIRLALLDCLQETHDLPDEETLDDLNVFRRVGVGAPVVVPLPVACPEHLGGLSSGDALAVVFEIAGQFIAVAEPGLEVIGKVVKGRLPRTGRRAQHASQGTAQVCGHIEVLFPFSSRLDGRQDSPLRTTGVALVDGVNGRSLLVKRQ